jgi:hypothetical protein
VPEAGRYLAIQLPGDASTTELPSMPSKLPRSGWSAGAAAEADVIE